MSKKEILKKAIFSISFAGGTFLLSCGGGGSGGVTTAPAPVVQEYSADLGVKVSPQGVSTQGLQAQSKKLKKLQTDNVTFIVEVISSDKNGNVIERKTYTADTRKPLGIKVKLSKDGGTITVSATADGFNKAAKSIVYNSPDELKDINIELKPVAVTTQIVKTKAIKIKGNNAKYVRFAFFRDKQGLTKLVVGESQIRTYSQAGAEKLIDVTIPLSKLQNDTRALKVQYRDFKPSDPEDYRNFPGEYTVNGQKLVSFGFDYLKITDEEGNNPFVSQQGLSSQLFSGEYYRLLRYVDCVQLENLKNSGLLQDEDQNKGGIQFTFYAFDWDRGAWVEAGQGVFVSSENVEYYQIGEDENAVDTAWDYIIQNGCINDVPCDPNNPVSSACVDVNNDGTPEDVSCQGNSVITDINNICSYDQQNNTYSPTYVVVSVTNPELEWKNLDFIAPEGQQRCCSITVKDEEGNPVSGAYVYVESLNANFNWAEGITSANGQATICTLVYNTDNPSGTVRAYDPVTQGYTEAQISFTDNCNVSITVEDPNKCRVEGKVVGENSLPVADAFVEVYDDFFITYRWTYTDANGNYSINVPCNTDLTLSVNFQQIVSFKVDGNISINEQVDDGTAVTMKDITLANNPPEGYIFPWDYRVRPGKTVNITVCAWDWEGDYPITYTLKDNLGFEFQGQIDANEWCEDIQYTANQEGEVTFTVVFTDSTGKRSPEYTTSIEVSSENVSPVGYIYGSVYLANGSYIYDIYIYAYDEDGDTINWSVSNSCNATTSGSSQGTFSGWGEQWISFSSTSNSCTFTLSLSDGKKTYSDSIILTYENLEPVIYLWAEPGVFVPQGTPSVTVYSYIYDDDTNWTCQWKVNGVVDKNQTSCDMYVLDLNNANVGDVFNITLTVTDPANNSSSESITIYYGAESEVNIIIQNK